MISLTEKASDKVKQQLTRRGKGEGLRIAVKTTGCSGFAYVLEYVDIPNEDDFEVPLEKFRVLVDSASMQYLQGSSIDYKEDLQGSQFVISNPNAQTTCGCGSSFSV
jgi:iron-sulfur cluster assembly accessory protein